LESRPRPCHPALWPRKPLVRKGGGEMSSRKRKKKKKGGGDGRWLPPFWKFPLVRDRSENGVRWKGGKKKKNEKGGKRGKKKEPVSVSPPRRNDCSFQESGYGFGGGKKEKRVQLGKKKGVEKKGKGGTGGAEKLPGLFQSCV